MFGMSHSHISHQFAISPLHLWLPILAEDELVLVTTNFDALRGRVDANSACLRALRQQLLIY